MVYVIINLTYNFVNFVYKTTYKIIKLRKGYKNYNFLKFYVL